MTPSRDVTVVIPTYNGVDYIGEVLTAVFAQDFPAPVHVLVIDSGSTDGTLDVIAQYPQVTVTPIPKAEFGHGRTRNLAAQIAQTHYVAFLTQDAIPAHSHWLKRLTEPLDLSPDVWGVFGRQTPRPHCPPLLKYEINGTFAAAGVDTGITLVHQDWMVRPGDGRAPFYSDVNSATRREVLTLHLPYRDVRYGEDQLFGRDVLAAGRIKAYAPAAQVIHSNDITLQDFAHRIFDEGMALKEAGTPVAVGAFPRRLARVARGTLGDTLRIARDPDYNLTDTLRWWWRNPRFHWAKWRGYRWAELTAIDDEEGRSWRSLEARTG